MKSDNMLIQWKFTYVFSFLLTVWFSSLDTAALSMKARGKRHTNPHSRQEHLIRNSRDYEVVYPVEVDERGVFVNHVSSLNPSRRKRRSVGHEKGPFRYQLELAADMFNMNLHLNEKLLGSDFAISTYKDDGTVETTRSYDNCFLIGESSASDYSVAINDCDGLAGMIKIGQQVYYIEPVLNHTLIKEKGFPPKPGRPHIVYKDTATLHGDTVDERSEEWWDLDKNQAAMKAKLSKLSEYKEAKSRKKRQAVYTSYIRFYNIARRTVKVYYMRNGKPKFFTRLGIQNYLNVNTYRGVIWIVLDEQSGKPMHLNMSSNFVSTKSSRYNRLQVYITIPMGEVFPEYIPPRRPDSRVAFKNPSARFVQIFYMDTDNNTHKFKVVWPLDSANVDTYTEHRWTAEDYDTYKPLLLNNKPYYYAKAQKGLNEVIVSVPEGTKFPVITYPDIDKQPPKYIEVMATADESVVRYHGKKDVARYTLTLMNIVSLLFRHRSIGVNIYFVVVRLSILQKNPPGIKITRQPMKSLNSVCRWGHSVRRGQDKSHQAFYDQTVFLTRKSFGPSGYAPVFGMCNRLRSCTLNDDDGFGSAFIVAHETGHTVGMEHDGQRNNCSRDTIKGSIMAPLVRSRFDRYHWSSCSRNELLTNLPAFWCLNDKPFNNSIKYQKKLPGEYFNLDDQCKKQYGSGYKFCSKYARNPCRALWCIQRTNPRSYCRSRYTPALDGSSCGKNKWCRIGYCVEVNRGNRFVMPTPPPPPKPIHGGWGKWSLFGSCSADCGTGVRTRSRKCDSPSPKNNGKPCEGASDQSKLCFSKKCKDNMLSPDEIRDQQCKSRGPTITKLVKKWKRYDFSKVNMNCTFEKDLCSWRQSLGDSSDWKQISGRTPSAKTGPSFDHTLGKGKKGKYVYFETSRPVEKGWKARLESKMIGLKLSCLKFYFHSYGDFDHMGQLRLIVRFQNKEKTVWRTTQNYGDRWIPKEVTLVSEQHPFMIIFEAERGDGYLGDFAIDDISLRAGACKLQFRPADEKNRIKLNPCNTYCEAADGIRNDIAMIKLKDGTRCYDYDNPHDICLRGSCIKFGCDNKMDSSKKTDECGVCGGTGSSCTIVKGTVKIVAEKEYEKVMQCPVGTTNIFFEESVKSSNFLSIQILEKNSRPSLNGDDRLWKPGRYRIAGTKFIYSIDEQGKESLKAIDAIQKPIIITVKRGAKPNAESTVTYKFSKPKSAITVEYNWTFGSWSHCSKTCGPGIQKRSYLCARKHDNLFVNERFCRFEKKPPAPVRKCERRPCVFLYKWILRKWRRCSKTCGGGYRYRSIRCIELWRNVTVGSSHCRKTMKVPLRRTSCNKQPCPSQWHAEKWGECSVTCGKGNRSRNVTCLDHKRTLSKKCNDTNKPPTTEECHLDECGNFTEKKQRIKGLSCSFENGFCKWSNVKRKDDFDFKLGSGRTPSDGTGPRADNTLKNRKGKYVYIEGSSPRRRGDTAQLISPKLNVSSACISFFYHMFGEGIGRLSLYVKTSKKSYRLFFRYGNKGGFWNEAAVSVSTKQAFQIVFEAVRGRSFRSDICLDDIVVETGKCRRGSITTEAKCTDDPSINCPGITQGGKSNWCTTRKYKIRCCESCKNNVLNKKTK